MAKLAKQKRRILRVLDDINNSISESPYSSNFDRLLCFFISPVLFIGAISLPLVGLLLLKRPLSDVLIETMLMFVFASAFEILPRLKIEQTLRHHAIAILYSLIFLYCIIRYYIFVGPALWTFGFIQIVLSLSQNSKTMLVYSAITLSVAGLFVTLFPAKLHFEMNLSYYLIQFALFSLLYLIATAVYGINKSHLDRLDSQLIILKNEISERKIAEERSNYLALYDQLTGLPNRSLFCDRLNQAIEFSTRNNLELFVLFIDIDLFKAVNDTLGHACGDELLIQIGARLSEVLRSSDAVCRVSGDEFLIMLQDMGDYNKVVKVTERILEKITTPFLINDNLVHVSCSIGISKFPDNGNNTETLIKNSDIAMYKAKQDGKNRFAIFSDDLKMKRLEELEVVNALQCALANEEFRLHYQPQVDGRTKQVVGFEALIRWAHPTRGLLGAGEIIPVAERTGLIVPIGEWVLKTACRQNIIWQEKGITSVPMAINVSVKQLTSSNFHDLVENTLVETGMDPTLLELEITETMLVQEIDIVGSNIRKIRNLGVHISVDDFGMGYSAIQYLKTFPVDKIKIPMSFIHGIDINVKDESIISVIIALADSLGIDVVAEGVETDNQFNFLMNRSCSIIQGFLFSKPMAADDALLYTFKNGMR
jgi:diguanylate cyclase (GGDEF)-like protein